MSRPAPTVPIAGPAQGLSEHKHCEVCGKSIALDGRVCSDECVKGWQNAQRMKKRSVMIVIGMVFIVVFFSIGGFSLLGIAPKP